MKHIKYGSILVIFCLMATLSCHKKDDPTPLVYHKDGDVGKDFFNDPNGVNVVVLGDGFIKEDLNTGGNYDKQVKNIVDYLFTVAPFAQNKQHFNVYTVYAESKQRSAATGFNPREYQHQVQFLF